MIICKLDLKAPTVNNAAKILIYKYIYVKNKNYTYTTFIIYQILFLTEICRKYTNLACRRTDLSDYTLSVYTYI